MKEEERTVLSELTEGVNFVEKIVLRVFKKDFIKAYKKGVKEGFNWSNRTVR